MTPIMLAVLSLGAVAGLAIVGIAIWMMRTEAQLKEAAPESESAIPVVDAAPVSNASDASPPESASPPPSVEYPDLVSPPPPVTLPAAPAPSPDWLNSLAPDTSSNNAPAPASAPSADDEELLRLWRSADGDLTVEIGGRRYRSRFEIADETSAQRLMNALGDLNYFVNSRTAAPISATPPPAAPPPDAPPPQPAESGPAIPFLSRAPAPERPVVKVSLKEAARKEVKPPSMDVGKQWRYLRDQKLKPEIQIKSVMEEIDEVLQVILIGTPLAGRGLKVSDGPHGAMFSLDGLNYDSVDAIPDAEAREAVRSAIQKWDQK